MKNIFRVVSVPLIFLMLSPFAVHADVSHFEDGHTRIDFKSFGMSLELPSEWTYKIISDNSFRFYPDSESKDVYFMLSFHEYPDKNNILDAEEDFLKATVEAVTQTILEKPQINTAKMNELSTGLQIAIAADGKDDTAVMSTCVHAYDYMISFTEVTPAGYKTSFSDDIVSILTSIKEL